MKQVNAGHEENKQKQGTNPYGEIATSSSTLVQTGLPHRGDAVELIPLEGYQRKQHRATVPACCAYDIGAVAIRLRWRYFEPLCGRERNGSPQAKPRGSADNLDRANRDPNKQTVLSALRYYWITSRGYRLRPWRSPYIRWRMETFFGPKAEPLTPRRFFSLMWRERRRLREFLEWVEVNRRP